MDFLGLLFVAACFFYLPGPLMGIFGTSTGSRIGRRAEKEADKLRRQYQAEYERSKRSNSNSTP